ncbi:cell division protein ZapA [Lentilactobacillus senioris]|uniref:cell division protein ZapA n=1 Tax=Lentilactobacillus senioris TaxID=931534 RepID=UPI00227F663D|nr:cell division protein ZapA [Lentilactobacillus senioris]MCY9807327.1 cell division protein ZapA [Lentilactobacillus senioris]
MADNKRRFKTEIDGKTYILVGAGTQEHMQAVSDLLNEQLAELKEAAPQITDKDRAILLAFNAISKQLDMETNSALGRQGEK